MPTVLTLVVGQRLSEGSLEDHWSLRDAAASLLILICQKYGDAYAQLQPRVLKTLLKAICDPTKGFPSKYGAIMAFSLLGPDTIEAFIIPNIKEILEEGSSPSEMAGGIEKEKLEHALLAAIGKWLKKNPDQQGKPHAEALWECFGEKLLPFLPSVCESIAQPHPK